MAVPRPGGRLPTMAVARGIPRGVAGDRDCRVAAAPARARRREEGRGGSPSDRRTFRSESSQGAAYGGGSVRQLDRRQATRKLSQGWKAGAPTHAVHPARREDRRTCSVLTVVDRQEGATDTFKAAGITSTYDQQAAIGRRYRRQDEVGTPFCVTVDFDTANDQSVTVRHRDRMTQDRVAISQLNEYIAINLKSFNKK